MGIPCFFCCCSRLILCAATSNYDVVSVKFLVSFHDHCETECSADIPVSFLCFLSISSLLPFERALLALSLF